MIDPDGSEKLLPSGCTVRTVTRIAITLVLVFLALALPTAAPASLGPWRVVSTGSDYGADGFVGWPAMVHVAYDAQGGKSLVGKVQARTSRRMLVKFIVTSRCYDDTHERSDVHERRVRTWISPGRPFVRVYWPTFAAATKCYYGVWAEGAKGQRGRLSVVLSVRS